jgi:hypothetical protein
MAFEQGDNLTSTVGEKIINEIEQLEVESYPHPGLRTATNLSGD